MISYQYNGIVVQLTRTAEMTFEQTKEPYGVDTLYTTYNIRVKGFLSQAEGTFQNFTPGVIAAVKAKLEAPRKPMTYAIAGQTIVSVPANAIDAAIGPWPTECRITECTSGAFMVECGCKVSVVDCTDGCPTSDPVISLRWKQTESFDENWYSVLTTDGRLVVRSDLFQSADNFRPLATPPLLNDYIRTTSRYTLSPSGTELEFYFEDHERDRLPPFPATKATGTYTVESPKPGYMRFGTVDLKLEGQKGTDRKALLVKAIAMAYAKLAADQYLTDGKGAPQKIMWGKFAEDLFEPMVHITVTAMMSNITKGSFTTAPGGGSSAASNLLIGAELLSPLTAPVAAVALASRLAGGGGGAVGGAANLPPAPTAIGNGAYAAAAAATAVIMPSVGQETLGFASNQPGIAPPDRKRIAGLLTALFRDPCLCFTQETELRSTPSLPTNARNSDIVSPTTLTSGAGPTAAVVSSTGGTSNAAVSTKVTQTRLVSGTFTPGSAGTASTISVGTLSPANKDMGLLKDNAPYTNIKIETETEMDTGFVQLPGTGVGTNGGTGTTVKSHGGMMRSIVAWSATRSGAPPVLPAFQSPNPNLTPLYGKTVIAEVNPSPDGAVLEFSVAGYYVYAVANPSTQELQPAVPQNLNQEVSLASVGGAGFWTNTSTFLATNGVQGGLPTPKNSNPFVSGGVNTSPNAPLPTNPPGFDTSQGANFDLSGLSGAQLNSIIQTGNLPGHTFPAPAPPPASTNNQYPTPSTNP